MEKSAPPDNQRQDAADALAGAQSAMSAAEAAGKNATAAEAKLREAQAAYDAGNYTGAIELAAQAKDLAAGAPGIPPVDPAAGTTSTPSGGSMAGLVALGLVVVALGLGGLYWFLRGARGR